MKRLFGVGITLMVTCVVFAAQSARTADVEFKAAQHKEEVEGDLKGAIEQYKKIADGKDRALAAQALLRMADAYQKLGYPQSRAAYDRVINQFADQKAAAAQARAKLAEGSTPAAAGIALRKVTEGIFLAGVSRDGRFMIHHNGELLNAEVLRDLSTGVDQKLDVEYVPGDSVFSPNGAQVAYAACPGGPGPKNRSCEVRVVSTTDDAKPRRLYASTAPGSYVGPLDWSADGKWIAVYIQRRTEQSLQLGMLRVSDGSMRVLQSVAWGRAIRGFFSPEGDLAVSLPVTENEGARDIFLMDVEGARQTPLVTNPSDDFPLGWTPDGKHLLFGSNRNGAIGVWAQPVANRKPVGVARLIKSNIGGEVLPVGVTKSGTLYYGINASSVDVDVVPIDLGAGKAAGPLYAIQSPADQTWAPAWSADGKSLAYLLVRNSENILGIRSTTTGVERELPLGKELNLAEIPSWAPDGLSVALWGRDLKGRYGFFRIDVNTGQVTSIAFQDPPRVGNAGISWSSDGKKMYYTKGLGTPAGGGIYELEGETQRLIAASNEDVQYGNIGTSPDRRWWAMVPLDKRTNSAALTVQPAGGGDSRVLYRFDKPEQFDGGVPQWTPDGRAVLVLQRRDGKRSLLMIPLDGAAPRELQIDMQRLSDWRWFRLSPDGRQLAYMTGQSGREIWALENFASMLK